jgi:hypothetical protein
MQTDIKNTKKYEIYKFMVCQSQSTFIHIVPSPKSILDIYKCPKMKKRKKMLKNTTFSTMSYHNALIFTKLCEKFIVTLFFYGEMIYTFC